jgi:hypothetical protein
LGCQCQIGADITHVMSLLAALPPRNNIKLMLPSSARTWLAARADRHAPRHEGLSAVLKNAWGVDPFSGNLFVLLGKRRDAL